jgi:hypothetical protein
MSKRSMIAIVAAVAGAMVLWLGGQALWHALLAMHDR